MLTLEDIAALKTLWADANQDVPWQTFEAKDGSEGVIHLCDDDGAQVAWLEADDAGRANGLLITKVVSVLPALLALARRALEADARPDLDDRRDMAAAECRRLAGNPPESADGAERQLWRLACEHCAGRVEDMDVRVVSRLVLSERGAP